MIQRNEVNRLEWRWVIIWIIIALIITSIPYAVGLLRSTPDRVYGGFVLGVEDGYQYLAMMNEGAHGNWLFYLPYTSEPHTGTLFYIFHLLLGKLAVLTHLAPIVVYHLARLGFGALLLVTTYRFIAMFAASRAVRRIAFLLIVFSGGLGWLLILLGQPNWLGGTPIDLILPEGFTFLLIYGWPHIALAQTLLLAGLMLMWQPDPRGATGVRRSMWAGLCFLLMGLIVPFYVAVVYAILFAGWLAASIAQRRLQWREARQAIIAALIAAPILIYTVLIILVDPIWQVWSSQLIISSPHPLHYVAAYLLAGALAVIGLRQNQKHQFVDQRLIGWLLIVPCLLYLPFSSQRRLIEGWQIPLSIFAAIGLVYRVAPAWRRSRLVRALSKRPRYSVRGLRQWAVAALLIISSATYILLLTEQSTRMLAQLAPSFRDGGEIAALSWLDQVVTEKDVVLSSYDTGNFLPTRVTAHAFVGHGPETIDSDQKRALVAEFYATATPDAAREKFLQAWPITYVFYGPLEKQLGVIDLSGLNDLTLMYDQNDYQIFRVNR